MKDLNKYIFEDYNDSDELSSTFILKNIKHDKLFNKFIKICMKYKIYLFQKNQDSTYELRTGKNLIKLINRRKAEITKGLGDMILKLHSFDKYLETSITDNFSDIYDTKAKIDQIYVDYCKNYRYLDELIKMLNTKFSDDILIGYISKEYTQGQIQDNKNKNIIEEYSNN
jgi:hypothetical protein